MTKQRGGGGGRKGGEKESETSYVISSRVRETAGFLRRLALWGQNLYHTVHAQRTHNEHTLFRRPEGVKRPPPRVNTDAVPTGISGQARVDAEAKNKGDMQHTHSLCLSETRA